MRTCHLTVIVRTNRFAREHIYKCHSPKYCDRCYAVFGKEEELTIHRRSSPACDLKEPQPLEDLTYERKLLLKPRDRSSKSDEERWTVIYKICFPDDENVPSPCEYPFSSKTLRQLILHADYVHYSREVAEIRREVLGILQEEAQSADNIDFRRLIRRVKEAFNAQGSTSAAPASAPTTPSVLTPSTSNSSGGRSSQAAARGVWQNTPTALRTSRLAVSATRAVEMSVSDDFGRESELTLTDDGPPSLPSYMAYDSDTRGLLDFEQPQTGLAVPFKGFTTPTRSGLDLDQFQIGEDLPGFQDIDFSLPDDLDGIMGL